MTLQDWLNNGWLKPHKTTPQEIKDLLKKRNLGGYERAGVISDQEAKEMFLLARKIRSDVEEWLKLNHSELLQDD